MILKGDWILSNYNRTSCILNRINHCTTILMLICVSTPYFTRNLSPYLIIFLMIFWGFSSMLISITRKKIMDLKVSAIALNIIIWISWILMYRLVGISSAAWGNYYKQIFFFFFIFVGQFYINFMGKDYCERLLNVVFLVSMFNIVQNIYLLCLYPNASVELNYSSLYNETNIGGTMFSFYTVLMAGLILMIFKNKSKTKLICIIAFFLCAVYIFLAARATAIIMLSITIFLYGYFRFMSKRVKMERILYFISMLLLCFLGWKFAPLVLEFISNRVDNARITDRLMAVANLLAGNLTQDDIALVGRIDLYFLSVSTFLENIKNFIFGVGYHTTENLTSSWYYSIGVGGHSEFLDLAARYGLIGIILIANILRLFYKSITKHKNFNCYYVAKVIFMIFIFYSFVNNSFDPSIGMLLFLALPINIYYINMQKMKEAILNNDEYKNDY